MLSPLEIILLLVVIVLSLNIYKQRSYFKFTKNDPLLKRLRHDMIKLDSRANNVEFFAGSDKSYTENKKKMYLCLKDENGNYYPYNFLIYVLTHEMAHVISHSVDTDHVGKEFNDNFDMLLDRATEMGIWDPNEPMVMNYCGVTSD